MDKKTINCGIIGAGFAASFHYQSVRRITDATVKCIGVYSPNRARKFAAERGIRAFDTAEALIEACDVVHICVPPALHEEVTVQALRGGKHAIVEKPFTGYFGEGEEDFDARQCSRERMRVGAMASVRRLAEAEAASEGKILYAENWVFAPSIRKECEIIRKTDAQILWMHGEEAHHGSHAHFYGYWKHNGGGALIGKGCHPLTAALYLKRVEGIHRDGRAIRPAAVSCRAHCITRLPDFIDRGHLRTEYFDVEDLVMTHIVFEDGTVADLYASEIIHGGIHNWLEVNANNHRTLCNINPNTAMLTYNPREEYFEDIYTVEKTGTKQGWQFTSVDEEFFTGYPQEMEAFYKTVEEGGEPESGVELAADTISAIYSGYLSAERRGAEVEIERI